MWFMCQAKPGLRCKNHAMAAIATAQTKFMRAQQEFNAARTDSRKQQLQQTMRVWQNKLDKAHLEYDISTSGRHALENQIAKAESNNEDASDLKNHYEQVRFLSERRKKFHQALNKKPSAQEKRRAETGTLGVALERTIIMNRSKAEKLRKELTQQINDGVPDDNLDNVVAKIRRLEFTADACENEIQRRRQHFAHRVSGGCGSTGGC